MFASSENKSDSACQILFCAICKLLRQKFKLRGSFSDRLTKFGVALPASKCGPSCHVVRASNISGPSRLIPKTRTESHQTSLIMFSSPILQALEKEPSYIDTNPYRAKRSWPPDFKSLSPKDQFKLERRYRRRSKLAWARPGWTKFTKIAQIGTISCKNRRVWAMAPIAN